MARSYAAGRSFRHEAMAGVALAGIVVHLILRYLTGAPARIYELPNLVDATEGIANKTMPMEGTDPSGGYENTRAFDAPFCNCFFTFHIKKALITQTP